MGALTILHPVITVNDMEAALSFYRDLLGLEVAVDHLHDPALLEPLMAIEDPDVRAVILKCPDDTEIELIEFRRPVGRARVAKRFEDAGITFVTIVVDDIEEIVAELAAHGFSTNGPIVDHGFPSHVRVVYCFGPDGTPLTLAEFVPGP